VRSAAIWYVAFLLAVSTLILLVAAFADRRRGREIERDRSRLWTGRRDAGPDGTELDDQA
jgi:hypothetical protein